MEGLGLDWGQSQVQGWVLPVDLVGFVDQEAESHLEHLEEGIGSLEESRPEEEMVDRLVESEEEHHSVEMVGKAFHGHQEEAQFLQGLVEVRLAYRRVEAALLFSG